MPLFTPPILLKVGSSKAQKYTALQQVAEGKCFCDSLYPTLLWWSCRDSHRDFLWKFCSCNNLCAYTHLCLVKVNPLSWVEQHVACECGSLCRQGTCEGPRHYVRKHSFLSIKRHMTNLHIFFNLRLKDIIMANTVYTNFAYLECGYKRERSVVYAAVLF